MLIQKQTFRAAETEAFARAQAQAVGGGQAPMTGTGGADSSEWPAALSVVVSLVRHSCRWPARSDNKTTALMTSTTTAGTSAIRTTTKT